MRLRIVFAVAIGVFRRGGYPSSDAPRDETRRGQRRAGWSSPLRLSRRRLPSGRRLPALGHSGHGLPAIGLPDFVDDVLEQFLGLAMRFGRTLTELLGPCAFGRTPCPAVLAELLPDFVFRLCVELYGHLPETLIAVEPCLWPIVIVAQCDRPFAERIGAGDPRCEFGRWRFLRRCRLRWRLVLCGNGFVEHIGRTGRNDGGFRIGGWGRLRCGRLLSGSGHTVRVRQVDDLPFLSPFLSSRKRYPHSLWAKKGERGGVVGRDAAVLRSVVIRK